MSDMYSPDGAVDGMTREEYEALERQYMHDMTLTEAVDILTHYTEAVRGERPSNRLIRDLYPTKPKGATQ